MSDREEVIVVGAGAAGLSAAAELEARDVPALVLERSDHVAESWRNRYDSLFLNTPRLTTTLGRYRMPRSMGRWPTKDSLVAYLEDYARKLGLNVRFGVDLNRVERQNGHWLLRTSAGEMRAPEVVIATGHDHDPAIPDWPGKERFEGELIHTAAYRNPQPYAGRDVLVVGISNSGGEIADEIVRAGAGKVWISMRNPPCVFPREWPRGVPLGYSATLMDPPLTPVRVADAITKLTQRIIYGNLSKHGLPKPGIGAQTRAVVRHQAGGLIDAGFVDSLKAGKIEVVAAVASFEGPEVVLADGSRLRPDAVIAATGYDSGLEPLVGHLGVLDRGGYPLVKGGDTHPSAPDLYFNGYFGAISGGIRFMRRHGRAIARAIARERRRRSAAPAPASPPTAVSA